jgi:two-component system NtrC family sensor kinase
MLRFQDLKIRTKLVLAFLALLLPLVVSSVLTLQLFSEQAKHEAQSQLIRTVTMLYRLCESLERIEREAGAVSGGSLRAVAAQAVRDVRVGETGYAYVMDPAGNLLVHPAREGENIFDEKDSSGVAFIQEICQRSQALAPGEVGMIRYPWMNPQLGETHPRVKRLKYVYFRPWNWIIAAGSYESEIFQGVRQVRKIVLVMLGITLTLLLAQTVLLEQALTRPMKALDAVTQKIAAGDLSQQVSICRNDEIGSLAQNFNRMAEKLRQYTENLERTVEERSQELAESERKYRTFVESSLDGLVTTDRRGFITFANHAMEEMVGESRQAIVGRHISEFYSRGMAEAREIMHELERKGRFRNREMLLVNRDRQVPILTSASLLYNEAGEIIGTLGAFKDITERKKLELKLKRTQAQLVQTMKMRALGDLVAGVAHSINNPLMASNTILHVVMEDLPEDAVSRKRFGILLECNRRIEAIVKHLKEFARQSPGQFAAVDVNKTIEDALTITGQQLLNRNIRIEKTLDPNLPPVWGDANQIEEVIMELVANARDAMEANRDGKVLGIRTLLEREDGRRKVAIEVRDNGQGIPEEIRDKIFEPFFTTKDMGKGTGLGLSVCYGIVEDHGGTMEVESEPGRFTVFRVLLPALEEKQEKGEKAERQEGPAGATDSNASRDA